MPDHVGSENKDKIVGAREAHEKAMKDIADAERSAPEKPDVFKDVSKAIDRNRDKVSKD
jgi:hypothetical protein